MKQLTTFLCCVLFMLCGTMVISMRGKDPPSPFMTEKLGAATIDNQLPRLDYMLPRDVQLDLEKRTKIDTVYISKTDTVVKTVYKNKVRKVMVPQTVEVHDTLCVPTFYIAKPLEYKAESIEIVVDPDVHEINDSLTNHASELHGGL